MAPSVTLVDALARVGSLRALSKQLAADSRSDKNAETWRNQLQKWKAGDGITMPNAVILSDHLPGHPPPEELVGHDTEAEKTSPEGCELSPSHVPHNENR